MTAIRAFWYILVLNATLCALNEFSFLATRGGAADRD